MDDSITGWINGATGESNEKQVPTFFIWFSKNYAYSSLLLLPVFSLASYLSFFKYETNYLEHVVINAYITGHQAIFYTLFAIAGTFIDSDAVEIFSLLIAVLYTGWVFWQFFSEGNRTINILRSIMTYILYLIFGFCLLLILMGISEL